MDTNLKDQKLNSFIATTLSVLLITLILAVIAVVSYAPIRQAAFPGTFNEAAQTEKFLQSDDFSYMLADITIDISRTLTENEDHYLYPQYEELKNIKYYVKNTQNNLTASNISEQSLAKEIDNSQFYLHIITDEGGNPTFESVPSSFAKGSYRQMITGFDGNNHLANLDIVYTVPKTLTKANDILAENIKQRYLEQYMILISIIGGVTLLILAIVTMAVPYRYQKQASIVQFFNNLYLEFKALAWVAFILVCVLIFSLVVESSFGYEFNIFNIIYDANWYFYLIGIPLTFILLLLSYLSLTYLKHIYYTGIKEGLIKKSLFGKLLLHCHKGIKNTVNQIADVDITKDYNRQLFKLLGLNLFALIIIAITNGLGILLALAYTALLFSYSLKTLDKVRSLNEASSQLAKGDFNIVVPEDMGVLSPFAKSLNNIKDGFKVAVEKEIKSQNMKTELISNVSHDLKTPLTSIISYVDLLKNEDLDAETKKQYLEVLDQKSKRLKVLIEDLFEASKASSGNIELHLEQVDVIALLRQTLGEMEEKINQSTLQMKVNLPEHKVFCQLDGARTYRIFENIVGNILKYSQPNTRVYIDTEESDNKVVLIFKNISAYEMNFDPAEITERSFRGDKSRNTEGSGLGLAIAKSLVDLQNGNLEISIDGDLFKLTITFTK